LSYIKTQKNSRFNWTLANHAARTSWSINAFIDSGLIFTQSSFQKLSFKTTRNRCYKSTIRNESASSWIGRIAISFFIVYWADTM